MFYNKLVAVTKDQARTETLFLKSVREISTGEALAFLNSIYSNKKYCMVDIKPADACTAKAAFIPDVEFGGSFYAVTYENTVGEYQTACISSRKFPSGDIVMARNKSLPKYQKIRAVISVEAVSFAKVIAEYQRRKDKSGGWVFPDRWLVPCENL